VGSLIIDENESPTNLKRPRAAHLCNCSGSDWTRVPEKKQRNGVTLEQGAKLIEDTTKRHGPNRHRRSHTTGRGKERGIDRVAWYPVLMRKLNKLKSHTFLFNAKSISRKSRSPSVIATRVQERIVVVLVHEHKDASRNKHDRFDLRTFSSGKRLTGKGKLSLR